MNTQIFLVIFLTIPTTFVILDLVDRHLTRKTRYDGQPPKVETVVFLLVVLLGYTSLHFGGVALLPSIDTMLVRIGQYFAELLGRPLTPQSIEGIWLVLITSLLFYIAGLWDYLIHRFFSHSRWFWFTHENHHLPNQVFMAMPGIAIRPFAVVVLFPGTVATVISAYTILFLFGLPLWNLASLKILLLIHAFLLSANHSSFMRRWWWVHHGMKWLALTSPQEHLLHHTANLNGNYGNFTVLWDRLFDTYLDPTLAKYRNPILGLSYDQDFLGTITLSMLKIPASWRRRFQVGRYCNIVVSRD